MPQKKRQVERRSEAKEFRCTGFEKCNMVFTRSEHLARHIRKHTGEKPYPCVVPNCDRTFSRFDNMMQHTHTHNRMKKKGSTDFSNGMLSPKSVTEDNLMTHVSTSNSTHRPSFTEPSKLYMDQQKVLPHTYDKQSSMYYPQSYCPVSKEEPVKYQPNYSSYTHGQPSWNQMYYTPVTTPQFYHPSMVTPSSIPHTPISSCSSESESSYQPRQSTPDSEITLSSHNRKNSIFSESNKRRLSYAELYSPIQELGSHEDYSSPSVHTLREDQSSFSSDDDYDEVYDERQMSAMNNETNKAKEYLKSIDGIDITEDEYEALQGFSKFCAEPYVLKETSNTIKLPPLRNFESRAALLCNTNLHSQVYAFRQRVSTVPESFQRGAI